MDMREARVESRNATAVDPNFIEASGLPRFLHHLSFLLLRCIVLLDQEQWRLCLANAPSRIEIWLAYEATRDARVRDC